MRLPVEHPLRRRLAEELHARPFESIAAPGAALSVAVLRTGKQQDTLCHDHLALLDSGTIAWEEGPAHARLNWRGVVVKWERHNEFYSFTFFAETKAASLGAAFGLEWLDSLPPGWLEAIPGETIAATHIALLPCAETPPRVRDVAEAFGGAPLVGNRIAAGAGTVVTDLQATDGVTRFVVFDHALNRRRAGRVAQRLIEIDTYRMMALLSLPMATRRMSELGSEEAQLASLMERFRQPRGSDDLLLRELGDLAARVEHEIADHGARFAATRAYAKLVERRLGELREQAVPGLQPLSEFLDRRFRPAVDSCAAAQARQAQLSERVARAAQLLQTRFELERERQNQTLLASLDRRQGLQLRMQETVEGLSVIAMTYYGVGIGAYLLKPMAKAAGIEEGLVTLVAVPVIGLIVLMNMRRLRRHLARPLASEDAPVEAKRPC